MVIIKHIYCLLAALNLKSFILILRRIQGNQLELIEQSVIHRLNGNCKRIHFRNAMIIPKVYIHMHKIDNLSYIFVLVATTSKLYRLIFPLQVNLTNFNTLFAIF